MDFTYLPFILLFCLLSFSIISAANPIPKAVIFQQHLTSEPTTTNTNGIPPTTYFEVTKPIQLPNTKPYSTLLLQHDFGNSYGIPPASAQYTRPSNCPSTDFAKIVLEWNATCKGRQLDRIIGIWLSGVELFRSCTAQPRARGIFWTVKKDITRYYSLLMSSQTQTLAVYLGNKLDSNSNGVYHVNVSIHYYPPEKKTKTKTNIETTTLHVNSDHVYKEWADLIIPISQNLPLDDALWFKIYNSNDVKTKQFAIPPNAYRAVLEVYVSVDEADVLWPRNLPNDYISSNNLTGRPGNGPFREVVVSLDGKIVGVVWPFTEVFRKAINPYLWGQISAIGSFDLPSYDIEITPLLGSLLNGKLHDFAFSVTNGLNVWLIDANLHVWLDAKSEKTKGMLLNQTISPLHESLKSNFMGLNGTFVTSVQRSIKSSGWVESSFGKIVTESTQDFNLSNIMVMGHEGGSQTVNQTIEFNDSVDSKVASSVHNTKSLKSFYFYLYTDAMDKVDGTDEEEENVTLGFNEKKIDNFGSKSSSTVLENLQSGQGSMILRNNVMTTGMGNSQQNYSYSDDKLCFFRNISRASYTIIYDKEGDTCTKPKKSRFDFQWVKVGIFLLEIFF